jgi:Uma2 family endonuclease
MSIVQRRVNITPDEYLEGEQYSDVKHEYVAGRLYAMVGASEPHNLIVGNLHAVLHTHLRGGPCRVLISDMKVRIADSFYYPDVLVCCDEADKHPYYKTRPVLIVEVLSPSTEPRDTLEKRIAYQSLASLQEYALAAQDRLEVKVYRRTADGWDLETSTAGDRVRLSSVGLEIPIERIYEDVWR